MALRNTVWKAFSRISGLGIAIVTVAFAMSVTSPPAFAQNNNDNVDPKYLMELAKYWSFGYENYKNKQYKDAIKHFWKVVQLDTINKFTKVYRYLGDSYFKLENADSAQYVYELGIKEYPDDVHLHRMVGYFQNLRGQFEEAIERYETVVELDPDGKEDWMTLASLYVKTEQVDEAISAYDKVLELDPDNLEAQNNKTALIASTGDVEAVIEEREKIREKDPQNSQVRFELGKMYFDQGNYELAIERFNEFLQLVPNDVLALENIGISYQRLERYSDAIATFRKIIEVQPENKRILAEISRCHKELAQFSTARNYANKVLALDRSYGLGWLVLGEVYEACADRCIEQKDGKVEFNDKLIYELADNQYKKALNDPQFRLEAERHRSYIKAVLPTTEDKFMHKGQEKAEGQCYTWIY